MGSLLLRSFTRAFGRSLGYQAARRIGWLIWPALLLIVAAIIAIQLGMPVLEWIGAAGLELPPVNQISYPLPLHRIQPGLVLP